MSNVSQLCNGLLSLGGDSGNTVPVYNVTPSELLVLRHIHGDSAVHDITFHRPDAERGPFFPLLGEYERLEFKYPARQDGESKAAVREVFPDPRRGFVASFQECRIPPECLKPIARTEVPEFEFDAPLPGEEGYMPLPGEVPQDERSTEGEAHEDGETTGDQTEPTPEPAPKAAPKPAKASDKPKASAKPAEADKNDPLA